MDEHALTEIVIRIEKRLDDIDSRLRALSHCVANLKSWKGWVMGAVAGLGALGAITGIVSLLGKSL